MKRVKKILRDDDERTCKRFALFPIVLYNYETYLKTTYWMCGVLITKRYNEWNKCWEIINVEEAKKKDR